MDDIKAFNADMEDGIRMTCAPELKMENGKFKVVSDSFVIRLLYRDGTAKYDGKLIVNGKKIKTYVKMVAEENLMRRFPGQESE